MAFPTSSLTNNQVHKEGNRAFVYDSTLGVWDQVREADITDGKNLHGEIGGGVTFPSGHILRSFYDQSSGATYTVSTTAHHWLEMDITITGTNSTSDYLLIIMFFSSLHNNSSGGNYIRLGARYSVDDWSSDTQFGTQEWYDRPLYHSTSEGIVYSQTVIIRAAHPTTSTYRVRPWIQASGGTLAIGQSNHPSTLTGFEIKG